VMRGVTPQTNDIARSATRHRRIVAPHFEDQQPHV